MRLKRRIKKYRNLLLVFVVLLFGFFLNKIYGENTDNILNLRTKSTFSVHVLDVGCADAIYINCNDKNILIDSGDVITNDFVVNYLKSKGVSVLDMIFATHPHRDHIGGMSKVIEAFTVNKFLMPQLEKSIEPTTLTYMNMLNKLDEKDIDINIPTAGEKFHVGDMVIEVLGPLKKYRDINNNSIVLKVTYGDTKFLFMGDAEKQAEEDLIKKGYNIESDVLKVGHHGSLTSTSDSLINAVKPEYAIISVGTDRSNLPKQKIIDKLNNKNIKVLRTDKSGNVVFSSDGHNISVYTEKDD